MREGAYALVFISRYFALENKDISSSANPPRVVSIVCVQMTKIDYDDSFRKKIAKCVIKSTENLHFFTVTSQSIGLDNPMSNDVPMGFRPVLFQKIVKNKPKLQKMMFFIIFSPS